MRLICEKCGLDLEGTDLFWKHGAAILCIPCSVWENHIQRKRAIEK